ncbi:NAD(P)H-hydrate dehydratase [Cognatilysobacter tabacisoli]|uniref:NAD(P)H-hydrate dehydratase n=1 Tax=Cognatilysobacter tabacisoli TaxID=2315424 RepID=UPI000E6B496E|nr:NAD(P)H-hydrate dehydratase [Lysobacter tabacisoli]
MHADAALLDTAALRAIEARAADALGDGFELMRRAGQAAWQESLRHWPQALRIVVVCGPGNNGGDGYVFAMRAREAGREVRVLRLPDHAPRSPLAKRACAAFEAAGGRVETAQPAAFARADLVVDALFGIGLARAPDDATRALIDAINASGAPVFALDVPSGVDAERGHVPGAAVRAMRTIEFIAPKRGLVTGAALDHVGERSAATLGCEAWLAQHDEAVERIREPDLARWLSPRRRDSHKGANGRVLCVGGDHGGAGAIALCAQAALRSGAGLVDVGTRTAHVGGLLARLPEAMVHALDAGDPMAAIDELLARAGVVAVGPGLGRGEWAQALFARVLASARPLVLDADALNLLAELAASLPRDCVLTPHPGEAARLLGSSAGEVQADRYAAAHALCERFDAVVVLKGAGTIVAAPGRAACVIGAGNPGMAVGGMGDVLCGVIAALRAQGLGAFDAACAGALLHSSAGDHAALDGGERGLLPSDLMPWLRRLANPEHGAPARADAERKI